MQRVADKREKTGEKDDVKTLFFLKNKSHVLGARVAAFCFFFARRQASPFVPAVSVGAPSCAWPSLLKKKSPANADGDRKRIVHVEKKRKEQRGRDKCGVCARERRKTQRTLPSNEKKGDGSLKTLQKKRVRDDDATKPLVPSSTLLSPPPSLSPTLAGTIADRTAPRPLCKRAKNRGPQRGNQ